MLETFIFFAKMIGMILSRATSFGECSSNNSSI